MTTIAFTILGEPASKSNSRKIVNFGKRAASIKSDKARDYEEMALQQIPHNARLRLDGRIRMTLKMYYAHERSDMDESIVLDVLQDQWDRLKNGHKELKQAGVYKNDRQVRERHIYHEIDAKNPRVEILIETVEKTAPKKAQSALL